ncbi:MAG: class I SAM-dependent RNA methyltransferase, partial [Gemmatimonadaceae bacterium]
AGAVEAARANAERAGVAADVELERRAISAVSPPAEPGWLVTNPPYGTRVGDGGRLRDLYAQLGNVARKRLEGWRVVLVSASARLDGHTGLRFEELLRTRNGGIPVRVLRGTA